MQRQVYLDGVPITINPDDNVGTGGQAVVIKHNRQALKLWYQPDPNSVAKIRYLLNSPLSLPPTVLQPRKAITDRPNGNIIGYSMSLLPSDFREIAVFFNHKLRLKENLDMPFILKVLRSAVTDLEAISPKAVVGDLSGRNIAFTKNPLTTFWYDIDSWVINNLPCPVWTEFFVDPNLVAQTLNGQTPRFSVESDRYSLSVILFWSLFLSHPFQGDHPHYTKLYERAQQNLWLFDSSVTPRNLTPKPEIISDDLLGYFEKVFAKRQRLPLPTTELDTLIGNLVKCTSCHSYYYAKRSSCPNCAKKTPLPTFTLIRLSNLVKAQGPLVFTRFQNKKLFTIAREPAGFVLYVKPPADPLVSIPLPHLNDLTRFEIVGEDILVVAEPDSTRLKLYKIANPLTLLLETTSNQFAGNRKLVFRGNSTSLLRLANRQLLVGTLNYGQLVERPLPLNTTPSQTWFWSDPLSDTVFGLFQVFSETQYWLVSNSLRREVEIPSLRMGEQLLDIVVKFDSRSIMIRRLTQYKGQRFIKTAILEKTGKLIKKVTQPASFYPHDQIHGCGYSHLAIFIPTDAGIIREDLSTGLLQSLPKTIKAVSSVDSLIHLGSETHFLVVRDQEVDYLTLSS